MLFENKFDDSVVKTYITLYGEEWDSDSNRYVSSIKKTTVDHDVKGSTFTYGVRFKDKHGDVVIESRNAKGFKLKKVRK